MTETGRHGEAPATDVPADVALDLLGPRRRRYALYRLDERDGPVEVAALAESIAAMEADAAGGVPDERRDRIEVALHVRHLPKAGQHGVVEYDRSEGVVRLAAESPAFEALLDVVRALEREESAD